MQTEKGDIVMVGAMLMSAISVFAWGWLKANAKLGTLHRSTSARAVEIIPRPMATNGGTLLSHTQNWSNERFQPLTLTANSELPTGPGATPLAVFFGNPDRRHESRDHFHDRLRELNAATGGPGVPNPMDE